MAGEGDPKGRVLAAGVDNDVPLKDGLTITL